MAERIFIFRENTTEIVLPLTPESYAVESGLNLEIVNIHELGDVVLTGYGTLATIKIACLLPAKFYSLARDDDPEPYIEQFKSWVEAKTPVRFIVGGTGVNIKGYIENFSWGERDGTNDVYADILFREMRDLPPVTFTSTSITREAMDIGQSKVETYIIQQGDTLSALCHKFYGNPSAKYYNKLAEYNGIKNPHLIYTGNTLKIPQPLL